METLHRRKIDVCCVQETRWTGAGAKVFNCTHCTTRYIGGQFVLSLKTSVHNNPLHHTTLVSAHHQHFSRQSHIRHELHHTHLHLYQRDHSDPSNNNQLRCWNASCHTYHLISERIFLLCTSTCLRRICTDAGHQLVTNQHLQARNAIIHSLHIKNPINPPV